MCLSLRNFLSTRYFNSKYNITPYHHQTRRQDRTLHKNDPQEEILSFPTPGCTSNQIFREIKGNYDIELWKTYLRTQIFCAIVKQLEN